MADIDVRGLTPRAYQENDFVVVEARGDDPATSVLALVNPSTLPGGSGGANFDVISGGTPSTVFGEDANVYSGGTP